MRFFQFVGEIFGIHSKGNKTVILYRMPSRCLLAAMFLCYFSISLSLAASPRQITTQENLSFPPEFIPQNNTTLNPTDLGHLALDPVELVRLAWQGYARKNPEPWPAAGPGATRFFFDSRALPWPSLKHHVVDGSDVGMRTMGVHAKLREMLGDEKLNDPEDPEAGTLAYVLDVTDQGPGSCDNSWMAWMDGRPESSRKCAPLAQGMGARHMKMLYE
ncbi:MAG: hypothetical protein QGH62_00435, partial [Nitrospinaceae bacterium]|nr:hypothetical protein [Nitrospinaceae bacterium]